MLVDRQLHTILDVDAQSGVGSGECAGHRQRQRRALGVTVTGRGGGFGSRLGGHLGAVLIDLNLLDDRQIALRGTSLFGRALITAGKPQRKQGC